MRKIENLDYPDAIEFLAKRQGLTVPETDPQQTSGFRPRADRKRILEMNRDVAKFYHARLFDNNDEAKNALAYLTEKRGLSLTTIRHFGIGYAPNSFTATSQYLLSLGYTPLELTEGYIAFANDKSKSLTDSFRNRVMFPIIDPSGNVIAFGGRVMDDSLPKYKNTSDTPAFKKSRNLFALNFARNACAERLILCEGYMDVISLHAAGFENAVATLGTAITPEQARMMSRYTKLVIISYDMDEAGRRAADKAMKLFEEVGLEVKLLKLEGAKDPDEFIKKYGKDKFRQMLDASDSKFAYNLQRILSQYNTNDPQQRIEAVNALLKMVANISASAERDIYLREISTQFEVSMDSLREDVKKIRFRNQQTTSKKESQALLGQTMGYQDKVNPDFAKAPSAARFEESVLGMLLVYPEYCTYIKGENPKLTEEDFFTEFGQRVFRYIFDIATAENSDDTEANLNEVFTPDEVGRITKMKVGRMLLSDNSTSVFEEMITSLKKAVSSHRAKQSTTSFEALSQLLAKKAQHEE